MTKWDNDLTNFGLIQGPFKVAVENTLDSVILSYELCSLYISFLLFRLIMGLLFIKNYSILALIFVII